MNVHVKYTSELLLLIKYLSIIHSHQLSFFSIFGVFRKKWLFIILNDKNTRLDIYFHICYTQEYITWESLFKPIFKLYSVHVKIHISCERWCRFEKKNEQLWSVQRNRSFFKKEQFKIVWQALKNYRLFYCTTEFS